MPRTSRIPRFFLVRFGNHQSINLRFRILSPVSDDLLESLFNDTNRENLMIRRDGKHAKIKPRKRNRSEAAKSQNPLAASLTDAGANELHNEMKGD